MGTLLHYTLLLPTNFFYHFSEESDPDTSQSGVDEVSFEIEPLDIKPVEIEIENFDLSQYLKKHEAKSANTKSAATATMGEEAHQSKKRRVDKDAIITEACEEMSTLLQNAKQHFVAPSPSQIFFNSVALQVEQAQLPPMDLMRLQQRLLELITHEIMQYQERTYNLES